MNSAELLILAFQIAKQETLIEQNVEKAEALLQQIVLTCSDSIDLTTDNIQELKKAAQHILRHESCLSDIPVTQLIALMQCFGKEGEKGQWTREVMIAMLRQHVPTTSTSESFTLNLKKLCTVAAQQTRGIIHEYVREIPKLPIEPLLELGKTEPDVARHLLNDILSHPDYFQLSAKLVLIWPKLEHPIAAQWKTIFMHFPEKVDDYADSLKALSQFSAFKQFELIKRCAFHLPQPDLRLDSYSLLGVYAVHLVRAATTCVTVARLPHCLYTAAVCTGSILAGNPIVPLLQISIINSISMMGWLAGGELVSQGVEKLFKKRP